ncbi:MAG: site-specific integrase, partial [Thiobacillus sp.]|nr:site-specific integrase [Thiobacillus sp.]
AIVKRKGFPGQSKTWNTRKEAEAWARQIESEMDRGVFVSRVEAERATLAEIIERYREDELPKKRGKGFGPALNALESALGKYSLAALSSKLITGYRKKRLASVSADTARKEINLLSKLIDLAGKEWGMPLPSNPCAMVSRPAPGKARDRRLEGDELGLLLAECEPHMGALIRFAIETAARLGEMLSVKWADVDLKKQVMIIRGIDERGTKNGDALRQVPLSSAAVEVLEGLKALPRSIDGRVFWQWKASDSFNKTWRRVCARAGVAGLRFHDLRHEATSRLFEKGVFDSMEDASITGHKTLQMLKRYTHLRAEDLAKKMG